MNKADDNNTFADYDSTQEDELFAEFLSSAKGKPADLLSEETVQVLNSLQFVEALVRF